MSIRHRGQVLLSTIAVTMIIAGSLDAADKRPIRKLTLDADAEVVGLFEAAESGQISVRVVPRDQFESHVFVTNKTKQPLTVKVPEAVVGVHVHQQFLPPGGILGPNIGSTTTSQGSGAGQAIGGTMSPFGSNVTGQSGPNSFFPGSGSNFFSIPPEQIVQLELNSVCLEHGKPDPHPKMTYALQRVEHFAKNDQLHALLAGYHPKKIDRAAMQAAAWHLLSDLQWEQLAALRDGVGVKSAVFSRRQLKQAQTLIKQAAESDGGDKPSRKRTTSRR